MGGERALRKPWYWVATCPIPINAKLGTPTYTITATDPKTGAHGVFYPFPTPNSLPTVVPYTYTPTVAVSVAGRPVAAVTPGTRLAIQAPID